MERIFELSGLLVMPFWLAMVLAPRWRVTARVMRPVWAPLLPAAAYAILVLPRLPELAPLLMSPKLGPIAALLGTPAGATIGWIHFLAFDLFVGRWIYLDSRERGLSVWWVSPVLFLTLMFGPFGLLTYMALRAVLTRGAAAPAAVPGGIA